MKADFAAAARQGHDWATVYERDAARERNLPVPPDGCVLVVLRRHPSFLESLRQQWGLP
jgi:hypothetical protein